MFFQMYFLYIVYILNLKILHNIFHNKSVDGIPITIYFLSFKIIFLDFLVNSIDNLFLIT